MNVSYVSKFADGGETGENDAIEKLWNGYASAILFAEMDSDTEEPLDENYSISDFDEETVKLDRWSDDLKFGLEAEIKQIDKDIKETKKQAAAASTLAEKLGEQKKLRALEGARNAKRRSLYEAQDKIDADRDVSITKVEKQLKCSTKNERIFVVRWTLK